jgi:hypothetical protein
MEKICFPKLHTLRFRRLNEETYETFGAILNTPSLKVLDSSFQTKEGLVNLSDTHFWEAATSAIDSSTLVHLRLHALKKMGESIRALVEAINSPLHLTLDEVDIDASFSEDLITGDHLGDLRTLELLNFLVEFDGEPVHALIEARELEFRGGGRLGIRRSLLSPESLLYGNGRVPHIVDMLNLTE